MFSTFMGITFSFVLLFINNGQIKISGFYEFISFLVFVFIISVLITFCTIMFGFYFGLMRILISIFKKDNDPFYVIIIMPLCAFLTSFILVFAFYTIFA